MATVGLIVAIDEALCTDRSHRSPDDYLPLHQPAVCCDSLMDPNKTVREILRQVPGDPFCAACLALICSTSLSEMRKITAALIRDREEFRNALLTCTNCRRLTDTIVYRGPGESVGRG